MIVSLKNEYSVHSGNDIDLYKSFRIIYIVGGHNYVFGT